MRKPLVLALAVLALVAALGYALTQKPAAPETTFVLLDGSRVTLSELRGKVVLVNFWATSCPGCVKEMPDFMRAYEVYHDRGFEIVAVAMAYDPPNYVANFTEKWGLPFPVALDSQGENARAFGNVSVTPTSFVIDQEGRIIKQKLGELDFAELKALLDKVLS